MTTTEDTRLALEKMRGLIADKLKQWHRKIDPERLEKLLEEWVLSHDDPDWSEEHQDIVDAASHYAGPLFLHGRGDSRRTMMAGWHEDRMQVWAALCSEYECECVYPCCECEGSGVSRYSDCELPCSECDETGYFGNPEMEIEKEIEIQDKLERERLEKLGICVVCPMPHWTV